MNLVHLGFEKLKQLVVLNFLKFVIFRWQLYTSYWILKVVNKTLYTSLQYDIEFHPIFRDCVLCLLHYLLLSDFENCTLKLLYIFVKPKIG